MKLRIVSKMRDDLNKISNCNILRNIFNKRIMIREIVIIAALLQGKNLVLTCYAGT